MSPTGLDLSTAVVGEELKPRLTGARVPALYGGRAADVGARAPAGARVTGVPFTVYPRVAPRTVARVALGGAPIEA